MDIEKLIRKIISESITDKTINESSFYDFKMDKFLNHKTISKIIEIDSSGSVDTFLEMYINDNGLDEDDSETIKFSDDFIEWFKSNELEYRFEQIRDNIWENIDDNSGTIRLYRAITVSDNWLEHIEKDGKRLGIYWSWSIDGADTHWGNYKHSNTALLTTIIQEKYVNWDETYLLNLQMEEEREIRLFKNTPIKIESIEINGNNINIDKIKNKIFLA